MTKAVYSMPLFIDSCNNKGPLD